MVRVNCKIQYVATECFECGSMVGQSSSNLQLPRNDKTFITGLDGVLCHLQVSIFHKGNSLEGAGRTPQVTHKVNN
jgi:hypothetical protein